MPFDTLLSQSAKLESKLEAFFALPLTSPAIRWNACRQLISLGFEHAQSLKFLVSIGQYTSAAALLRVQYESLVRAIWMLYVATDEQVEDMMAELTHDSAKKANKLPMLSVMLIAIEEKAPHAPVAHLNEFKHYSWRPLSSYVHGGIHAINRHSQGFPVLLVETMVKHSNGLLSLAGSFLLVIACIQPSEGRMTKIYQEFADCLPMLNPPFQRTDTPAY
jgi:hypothetical protein